MQLATVTVGAITKLSQKQLYSLIVEGGKLVDVMSAAQIEATQRAVQEWTDYATATEVAAAKGKPAMPGPVAEACDLCCVSGEATREPSSGFKTY